MLNSYINGKYGSFTKMATVNRLSLDAVLPGGSIRFTEDGLVYAVDLVSIVTGKNKHEAAEVLRRLPDGVYSYIRVVLIHFMMQI